MNSGYDAYGASHKATLSGRALEGEAFMRAVNLLKNAQGFPENKRLWIEALEFTRKLWTLVQADLKNPDHPFEDSLKANLLSLSLYVDRQCVEVTKKPHPQMLQGLIDVNYEVACGLLSTGNTLD